MDAIEKEVIIINQYKKDIQSIKNEFIKNLNNITKNKKNTQKTALTQEELNGIIEEIRHRLSMLEKYLKINIDEQLEIPISKIIDMKTEEIIRQIPADWIIQVLRGIEELKGVFYSKEI